MFEIIKRGKDMTKGLKWKMAYRSKYISRNMTFNIVYGISRVKSTSGIFLTECRNSYILSIGVTKHWYIIPQLWKYISCFSFYKSKLTIGIQNFVHYTILETRSKSFCFGALRNILKFQKLFLIQTNNSLTTGLWWLGF